MTFIRKYKNLVVFKTGDADLSRSCWLEQQKRWQFSSECENNKQIEIQ